MLRLEQYIHKASSPVLYVYNIAWSKIVASSFAIESVLPTSYEPYILMPVMVDGKKHTQHISLFEITTIIMLIYDVNIIIINSVLI